MDICYHIDKSMRDWGSYFFAPPKPIFSVQYFPETLYLGICMLKLSGG